MFHTKVVEKIKTHILLLLLLLLLHFMFSNFFSENCTVYEIMWKNTADPGRPQTTTRRMRIACWMPKTTDRHTLLTICHTYCFATVTMAARARLNVRLHAQCLYCYMHSACIVTRTVPVLLHAQCLYCYMHSACIVTCTVPVLLQLCLTRRPIHHVQSGWFILSS
jgi:hypothetical protein